MKVILIEPSAYGLAITIGDDRFEVSALTPEVLAYLKTRTGL